MKSVHANPPEKICRLCLSDSGVILPIFEGEVADRFSVPLPQKILSCLAIKVCADDPLPPHICHRCLYEVDRFHEFRETCKRTNTTFNKICNNSGESVPFDVNQVLEIKQELHDESLYHDAISELLSDDEGGDLGSTRLRKRNRCLSLLESMKKIQQAQSASSAAAPHSEQLSTTWMEQTKTTPSTASTTNSTQISTPLECRYCAKQFLYENTLIEHEEVHAKGLVSEEESVEQVENIEQLEQQQPSHESLVASPTPVLNTSTPSHTPVSTAPTVPVLAPSSTSTPTPLPPTAHNSTQGSAPTSNPIPAPAPAPALVLPVPVPTSTPAPAPVPGPNEVIQQTIEMQDPNHQGEQDSHQPHVAHSQTQGTVSGPGNHSTVEAVSLTDVAMLLEGAFDGVRPIVNPAPNLCRYCQEQFSNPDLLRRHERLYCNRKPSLIKSKTIQPQQQQQQQHAHPPHQIQHHPSSHHSVVEAPLDTRQQHGHATHHLVIQQQHSTQGHQLHQPAAQIPEQQIIYSQKVVVETTSTEPTRSCKHCNKDFIHRGSLWRHQMFCDSNPERELNRIVAGTKKKSAASKNTEGRNEPQQHMIHGGVSIPISVQSVAGSQVRRGGIQTTSGPFKCKFCEKRFLHRGSWWRHQKMFCSVNPEIPTVKADTKVRTNQGIAHFACRFCNRTFLHRGSCWHHEQTHTGLKEHACRYCSKTFNEKSRLARHERMHLGIKPFSCRQCGKAFCDASNLRNHEQIHGDRATFLCAWCGKSYTRRALLLKHEQVHAGEGQVYKCASCPRSFPDPDTLNEHTVSHAQERKKLYLCQTCGQTFRSQSLLSQHGQQNHPHVQQSTQPQQHSQQQHIQQSTTHQNQQTLHSCNICNKAFSDVSALRHHELNHSNTSRQYRCPNAACNAVFHQRSQLDAHLLMHEGGKAHAVPSTVTSSSAFHSHPQAHTHPQQQLMAPHELQHQQALQHQGLLHREGTYVIEGQDISLSHLVTQLPQ